MALDSHEELLLDHQKARDHIDRYKTAITNGFLARIAIVSGAIHDFHTWRDIKDAPDSTLAILEAAFAIVSTAVPALKLGAFVKKHHEAASNALRSAHAFARQAKTADKVVHKVTDLAIKGTDVKEKADKIMKARQEIMDKMKATSPEIKDGGLHVSRGPIKQLIEDIYAAPETWETAIEAETQEWANRMSDIPLKKGALSLEQQMKNMLPLPERVDTDETWKFYLYELIVAHCKKECYWEEEAYSKHTRFVGLNNTQMKKIIEWFGPGTVRGRHFQQPAFYNIGFFLAWIGLPTKKKIPYVMPRVA